jgi:predicted anti-sigma-YlaC factor YlaD
MMTRSCREVTRLVSQGEDRRLALGERIALRLHFAICEGCRNMSAQIAFLRRAARRLSVTGDKDR